MTCSVLSRLEAIESDPYPHLVIHDALPADYYQHLVDHMPLPSPEGLEANKRRDLSSVMALRAPVIDQEWRSFIAYHTGPDFLDEVRGAFSEPLSRIYPDYEPTIDRTCGPRGGGDYEVQMECQPGYDTPVAEWGTVRGPHLDNPVEIYGGLLYMRSPEDDSEGGHLEIQRWRQGVVPEYHGKLEIRRRCVETVGVVPYRANTLVMFLNTPDSIHAVTPREPTGHYRYHVNFIGEARQPLFKIGHGRY